MARMLRAVFAFAASASLTLAAKPNIVVIFPDDQDLQLGSTDYQSILQQELAAKGTTYTNHYATVAQCCPSRASMLRGQAAHNTNITYISAPGGNYDKWLVSEENNDYLPHWLVKAGYNAEYIGKFMNGFNVVNYVTAPGGWTHIDALVDPYTYDYNNVVMSANGETPIAYHNYHQTDIIRVKALDRLEYLADQDKPFYIQIAPTAPHFSSEELLPVPLARHATEFPTLQAPRPPNFNPDDEYTSQKPSYLKTMPQFNATGIAFLDLFYRRRIQCLQGIDEIIQDVIEKLTDLDILENTYIIYTSDNGYHIGNHRMPPGKALPYREDTNMPLFIRGPGVPANVTSNIPSVHTDFAPTFLDIAGLPENEWPEYLDGRSLLSTWLSPTAEALNSIDDAREIMNVEFWGVQQPETLPPPLYCNNSYKTLRIVSQETSYLYSKWCTNETELYDTTNDPYELTNLAINPDVETTRLLQRLNALLLATKSCAEVTCRNPWRVLQPDCPGKVANASELSIASLDQAMAPEYDDWFASFPQIAFQECLQYQSTENEQPFWPENPSLGSAYRQPTDNFASSNAGSPLVVGNIVPAGSSAQRNATLADIMLDASTLNALQLPPYSVEDQAFAQCN
ncbi:arylsulfatase [Xylariales sp. PMI_506]|nr:arylsulfatase [Xylariales sp. PMI_506]